MTAAYPLPPISDADWPEEIADMTGGFAGKLNVYRTMAHDPALLRAWTDLRQHVVLESALGLELVEVVILRTGVRLNSRYEWQQHISRARKVGFDDARIAAVREMILAEREDGRRAEGPPRLRVSGQSHRFLIAKVFAGLTNQTG